MKLWKKIVLLPTILSAMALTACGSTEIQYRVPELNVNDQKRLGCVEYPSIEAAIASLPENIFLSSSSGAKVITDGQYTWVRHDIANKREAVLIRYGAVDGKLAHFICRDNLEWLSGTWRDLQEK